MALIAIARNSRVYILDDALKGIVEGKIIWPKHGSNIDIALFRDDRDYRALYT